MGFVKKAILGLPILLLACACSAKSGADYGSDQVGRSAKLTYSIESDGTFLALASILIENDSGKDAANVELEIGFYVNGDPDGTIVDNGSSVFTYERVKIGFSEADSGHLEDGKKWLAYASASLWESPGSALITHCEYSF
jgi:hypothetical protein